MIPQTIHYCWFGKKPLPKLALKCIGSWRKFFPEFEIKEWNEYNFDVNVIPYTAESYKKGKFAFVSDYARYWILYKFGGIYFDTDVEVIKSFNDIITAGPFLGIEKNRNTISINPGLGMGAYIGMNFYKEMLTIFENWDPGDISFCPPPLLVNKTTESLEKIGLKKKDILQNVDCIKIYPNDFFNPLDDYTGKIHLTHNTVSIHHYAKSWIDNYNPLRNKLTHLYHRFQSKIQKS